MKLFPQEQNPLPQKKAVSLKSNMRGIRIGGRVGGRGWGFLFGILSYQNSKLSPGFDFMASSPEYLITHILWKRR